ncbi:hypothetical protein VTK73DRAFT_2020 [Phialemonium thermophilum]|uniref:Uncharacterized protein n=1 Tax=Phialemonium thermophilum TaxID=223376 RepID=A0ABR3VSQ9_9PEZI
MCAEDLDGARACGGVADRPSGPRAQGQAWHPALRGRGPLLSRAILGVEADLRPRDPTRAHQHVAREAFYLEARGWGPGDGSPGMGAHVSTSPSGMRARAVQHPTFPRLGPCNPPTRCHYATTQRHGSASLVLGSREAAYAVSAGPL